MKNKKIKSHVHWVYSQYIEEWNVLQILNVEEISKAYYTLFDQDYGILSFLEQMWMFTKLLNGMVWDDNFTDLAKNVDYAYSCVLEAKNKLTVYLVEMFNEVNGVNNAIKFKSFDKEIDAYETLIKLKKEEIEKGYSVLPNQRKIRLLQEKIDHLKKLKQEFISSCKERSKYDLGLFLDQTEELVNWYAWWPNEPSLQSTFNNTNKDKVNLLEDFIKANWVEISRYTSDCVTVLRKFKKYIEEQNELCKKN